MAYYQFTTENNLTYYIDDNGDIFDRATAADIVRLEGMGIVGYNVGDYVKVYSPSNPPTGIGTMDNPLEVTRQTASGGRKNVAGLFVMAPTGSPGRFWAWQYVRCQIYNTTINWYTRFYQMPFGPRSITINATHGDVLNQTGVRLNQPPGTLQYVHQYQTLHAMAVGEVAL